VTRLPAPRGAEPAVLLVTPGFGVSTADAFAAFAGGARPGRGAALASSRHLAGELAAGMAAARLLERAGIMAVANDLAAAAATVEPTLVPFRRALGRLLGRPVGQSGSGPTLWVLYPSISAAETAALDVRGALAAGDLPAAGGRPPFVCATRIVAGDPGSPIDAGPEGPVATTHEGGS
jgi:4-diphosphocytidyl-2C-methyl-D-erythritol kinase